jgi:hypothetical protein
MSPFEMAMLVYATEPCARSFDEDLRRHHLYGYVFSSPSCFIMGRPVEKNAQERLIKDPSVRFYNPDAWLVYLAAGDLAEFFKHEPYPLPWLGWERDNHLRFYRRDNVRRLLKRGQADRFDIPGASPTELRPTSQRWWNTRPTGTTETACAIDCCGQSCQTHVHRA